MHLYPDRFEKKLLHSVPASKACGFCGQLAWDFVSPRRVPFVIAPAMFWSSRDGLVSSQSSGSCVTTENLVIRSTRFVVAGSVRR